jgi:hypothetical protein
MRSNTTRAGAWMEMEASWCACGIPVPYRGSTLARGGAQSQNNATPTATMNIIAKAAVSATDRSSR